MSRAIKVRRRAFLDWELRRATRLVSALSLGAQRWVWAPTHRAKGARGFARQEASQAVHKCRPLALLFLLGESYAVTSQCGPQQLVGSKMPREVVQLLAGFGNYR